MDRRFTSFIFLTTLFVSFSSVSHSKQFFCKFGPETKVIDPIVSSKDGCTGSAKIQAKRWKCGAPSKVDATVREFFDQVVEIAEKRCQETCEERSNQCEGVFQKPPRCGKSVPSSLALETGQNLGCNKDCEGEALIYCSIYDAGIVKTDEAQMKAYGPNCFCRKTAKKRWSILEY